MSVTLAARHAPRRQAQIAAAKTTTWHPSKRQYVEPDTTFLLDPDSDTANGVTIGLGGLLNAQDSVAPSIVAGRYRKGIQPTTNNYGYLWMPVDGILPASQWTIELQALPASDLAALASQGILQLGNSNGGSVSMSMGAGVFSVTVNGTTVTSPTYSTGSFPAGSWISIAATFKAGTVTLYVNETQVAQATGVTAPTLIASEEKQDGFTIAGIIPHACTTVTLSDLRVSRTARVPGQATTVTAVNSIVVANATTGKTIQKLNGVVQPLTGGTSYPLPAAASVQASQQAISVIRDDKFLQATPILAGATPDAAHPSVGHSGLYCYDWQVVDRTLNYIVNTLKAEPYISLDNVPSILGGTHGPYKDTPLTTTASAQVPDTAGTITFTTATPAADGNGSVFAYGGNVYSFTGGNGAATLSGVTLISGTPGLSIPGGATVHVGPLTCGWSYWAPENPGPPNNNSSFASICADLAYHILNETNGVSGATLGLTSLYMGLWNEPDQSGEWTGTTQVADYQALYAAVAPAVKAISANIKVGGPEISGWSGGTNTTWAQALINYCKTNSLPLDFVSYHYYLGDLAELIAASNQVQSWATTAGLSVPSIIVGEWGVSSRITGFSPGAGTYPFCQPTTKSNGNNIPPAVGSQGRVDFAANDFCAAFHAAGMVTMQNAPGAQFVKAIHYTGSDSSLFDGSGNPQALYNVMRMWSKILGLSVLSTTVTADPGIFTVAAKDGSGNVYVFIANLRYRKTHTGPNAYPVSIDVSAFAFADGTAVTEYLVDDQTSNAYDTQGASTTLQSKATTVAGGKVQLSLRPRAVALAVI